MLNSSSYNPDVLTCLANLSSDEVFTSPQLANQILDMLPKSIWGDKNARFLDPVSKSGVFLREITSRLVKGLTDEMPNLDERRQSHSYEAGSASTLCNFPAWTKSVLKPRRNRYHANW